MGRHRADEDSQVCREASLPGVFARTRLIAVERCAWLAGNRAYMRTLLSSESQILSKHEMFVPMDPTRIELTEALELRYWTTTLRCSSSQLLDAIEAVGIATDAVADYLSWRYELATAAERGGMARE